MAKLPPGITISVKAGGQFTVIAPDEEFRVYVTCNRTWGWWTARIDPNENRFSTETTCIGDSPADAAVRLLQLLPFRLIDVAPFKTTPTEYVFVADVALTAVAAPPAEEKSCDSCRGSGRYVGLSIIEPCTSCGGSGRIA